MRETIFISHATPEDNEFTIWLASRLELMGYQVWIDKKELLGGETFWETIEQAVKDTAVKFLLVYSHHICYPDGQNVVKAGIQKEIDFARQVINDRPELKDFFIILHLDDAGYDLFPGAKDLNQIPFQENWAEGLATLLKKFNRDAVPKVNNMATDEAAKWYLDEYIVKNPIIERKELYYTNWWSVKSLPEYFYILRYRNEQQAAAVAALNPGELIVHDTNLLTTFKPGLNCDIADNFGTSQLKPMDSFKIKISDLLLGYEKDSFPDHRDAENHFKKLFKRALHNYFRVKQMYWYSMANKNVAYYHTFTSLPSSKTSFYFPYRETEKPKTKNLFGKHLDVGKWHFAISVKPALYPYVGFHLKSHLIFTTDGYKAIEDKELQHQHRRKKGKRMFNEEWRDLLLAFMKSMENNNHEIKLVTGTEEIVMKTNLEMFWSDAGYYDPKDLARQEMFLAEDREDLIIETE